MKREAVKYFKLLLALVTALIIGSCGFQKEINLDAEGRDFYETARLIMTKQEKDIYRHLPDQQSRKEFIQEFWAKRDPDPDTEENEFKQEFIQRIEYANRHFREGIPGWKTDRGRIYIYLGSPDKIEQRPFINDPSVKGLIWWGYYKYRLGLEFIDRTGDGRYSLNQQTGMAGRLLEVIERAKFGLIFNERANFENAFSNFELSFDAKSKEIIILIPVESIEFIVENRMFKVDFEFEFFIYEKGGLKKSRFKRQEIFEMTEEEVLQLDEIRLTFPYDLDSGEYYFDVVVTIKPDIGKVRKIFKIKF